MRLRRHGRNVLLGQLDSQCRHFGLSRRRCKWHDARAADRFTKLAGSAAAHPQVFATLRALAWGCEFFDLP